MNTKMILAAAISIFMAPAFAATEAEKACIEKTVEVKKVLAGESTDPVMSGYVAMLPELREKLAKDMEDPYRCSLAK